MYDAIAVYRQRFTVYTNQNAILAPTHVSHAPR